MLHTWQVDMGIFFSQMCVAEDLEILLLLTLWWSWEDIKSLAGLVAWRLWMETQMWPDLLVAGSYMISMLCQQVVNVTMVQGEQSL